MILDDSWWDCVEYLLKFTEPILSMICYTEMDRRCLGDVCDGIDSMIEKMKVVINAKEKDLEEKIFKQIQQIIVEKWNKMTTPLHLLAFAFCLKYYSQQTLQDSDTRVAPYRDLKVAQGYKAAIRRLFHQDIQPKVRAELMSFSSTNDCGLEAFWDKNKVHAHS